MEQMTLERYATVIAANGDMEALTDFIYDVLQLVKDSDGLDTHEDWIKHIQEMLITEFS